MHKAALDFLHESCTAEEAQVWLGSRADPIPDFRAYVKKLDLYLTAHAPILWQKNENAIHLRNPIRRS